MSRRAKLVIGMRTGITASDPDYPALVLLNSVYGSGVTSKLFVNVREKTLTVLLCLIRR